MKKNGKRKILEMMFIRIREFFLLLKPRTRREWIKLLFDVLIMLFFVLSIYLLSYSFNEGYKMGAMECYNSLLNYSNFYK